MKEACVFFMQVEVGAIVEGKVTGLDEFRRLCQPAGWQNGHGAYFRGRADLCEGNS